MNIFFQIFPNFRTCQDLKKSLFVYLTSIGFVCWHEKEQESTEIRACDLSHKAAVLMTKLLEMPLYRVQTEVVAVHNVSWKGANRTNLQRNKTKLLSRT